MENNVLSIIVDFDGVVRIAMDSSNKEFYFLIKEAIEELDSKIKNISKLQNDSNDSPLVLRESNQKSK